MVIGIYTPLHGDHKQQYEVKYPAAEFEIDGQVRRFNSDDFGRKPTYMNLKTDVLCFRGIARDEEETEGEEKFEGYEDPFPFLEKMPQEVKDGLLYLMFRDPTNLDTEMLGELGVSFSFLILALSLKKWGRY